MGHHNANLDPLGISCVNFDEAPVTTGFQHVGEKCFLSPQLNRPPLMSLFCVIVALSPSLYLSLSLPFPLSPVFQPPNTSFHLQTHFPHHNSCCSTLPSLSSRSPLFLYLSLVGGFAFGPLVCGGPLVSCRYAVTMWHSWTHLGLWMLIWIRAFPLTLLRHRINLVRSYE